MTGFLIDGGRVRGVETTGGTIRSDIVLIAAGIWGPLVGRLAGITIPLMPFRHLYAETESIPELAATRRPDVRGPGLPPRCREPRDPDPRGSRREGRSGWRVRQADRERFP